MANFLQKLFGEKEEEIHNHGSSFGSDEATKVKPIEVTDENFEALVLQAGKPAIVDLWAEWCGPCRIIGPTVEQLAAEYDGQAVIAKMNVDENPNTPGRYGIMGIPTLLYFKDGQEVDRQVGVAGYPQLATKLERLLA